MSSLTIFTACVLFFLMSLGYAGFCYALRSGRYTRKQLVRYSRRIWVLLLAFLQTLYIPLCEAILAIFLCRSIDGVSMMSMDLSQSCDTPSHAAFVSLGVMWTFIYTIGIPLLYFHSLVLYRVPYLVRVKTDVEYLRRLIEHASHDDATLYHMLDHSFLTLELNTRVTNILWNRFMIDHLSGAPLKIELAADCKWRVVRLSEDEQGPTRPIPTDAGETEPAERTKGSHLAQDVVPSVTQKFMHFFSPLFLTFSSFWHNLVFFLKSQHDAIYGISEPRSMTEFKVQQLVKYAKDSRYKIEVITWNGSRQFPVGSREEKLQKAALSSCGFLFSEFKCGAWYWTFVDMSKSVVIATGIKFISPGSPIQVYFGMLIMFAYLQLFALTKPFVTKAAQNVGFCAHIALLGYFWFGSVLITRSSFSKTAANDVRVKSAIMYALIILIFVLPASNVLYTFYANVKSELQGIKHKEKGGGDDEDDEFATLTPPSTPQSPLSGALTVLLDAKNHDNQSGWAKVRKLLRTGLLAEVARDLEKMRTWTDVFASRTLEDEFPRLTPLPPLPLLFRAPRLPKWMGSIFRPAASRSPLSHQIPSLGP